MRGIGKHLSCTFPIQNCLKDGCAFVIAFRIGSEWNTSVVSADSRLWEV
jgi:hypothetical protein